MTTKRFAKIAMAAALYAAVSLALAPMSYGPIQVRIAEALTMLPLIWQPA
ncbi:MAG: QueT transporter family protein, partial [Solobacterium sp.]|nr:QueT transporter family protein [Solobacterium sp.]